MISIVVIIANYARDDCWGESYHHSYPDPVLSFVLVIMATIDAAATDLIIIIRGSDSGECGQELLTQSQSFASETDQWMIWHKACCCQYTRNIMNGS